MKKLINTPETVLAESLDGFAAAHESLVVLGEERKFVRRRTLKPGKVALVSGGGSGHEPLHAGFVGHGMLDAACPGQVFTSPTPDQMLAAAQAEASQHYGCKNMRTEELYERPRSKVRKGTSWAIEPDRTFLELVFRWDDGGPQENTLVLELEWEPRL